MVNCGAGLAVLTTYIRKVGGCEENEEVVPRLSERRKVVGTVIVDKGGALYLLPMHGPWCAVGVVDAVEEKETQHLWTTAAL